jgi:hypothetical protein
MDEKRRLSARDTYVLDEESQAELERESLASVMRDLTNTMKRPVIIVEDDETDGDDTTDD